MGCQKFLQCKCTVENTSMYSLMCSEQFVIPWTFFIGSVWSILDSLIRCPLYIKIDILLSDVNYFTKKRKTFWRKVWECYISKKWREKLKWWSEQKRIWVIFCLTSLLMISSMLSKGRITYNLAAYPIHQSKAWMTGRSLCWSRSKTPYWLINLRKNWTRLSKPMNESIFLCLVEEMYKCPINFITKNTFIKFRI